MPPAGTSASVAGLRGIVGMKQVTAAQAKLNAAKAEEEEAAQRARDKARKLAAAEAAAAAGGGKGKGKAKKGGVLDRLLSNPETAQRAEKLAREAAKKRVAESPDDELRLLRSYGVTPSEFEWRLMQLLETWPNIMPESLRYLPHRRHGPCRRDRRQRGGHARQRCAPALWPGLYVGERGHRGRRRRRGLLQLRRGPDRRPERRRAGPLRGLLLVAGGLRAAQALWRCGDTAAAHCLGLLPLR
jgi:hypothetical protein